MLYLETVRSPVRAAECVPTSLLRFRPSEPTRTPSGWLQHEVSTYVNQHTEWSCFMCVCVCVCVCVRRVLQAMAEKKRKPPNLTLPADPAGGGKDAPDGGGGIIPVETSSE